MCDLSGVATYKKLTLSSSYQLLVVLQLGAELHVYLPLCWYFCLVLSCTGLAHAVKTSVFVCSAVLLCTESTVYFYSLTIFYSFIPYMFSSTIVIPELLEEGLWYRPSI